MVMETHVRGTWSLEQKIFLRLVQMLSGQTGNYWRWAIFSLTFNKQNDTISSKTVWTASFTTISVSGRSVLYSCCAHWLLSTRQHGWKLLEISLTYVTEIYLFYKPLSQGMRAGDTSQIQRPPSSPCPKKTCCQVQDQGIVDCLFWQQLCDPQGIPTGGSNCQCRSLHGSFKMVAAMYLACLARIVQEWKVESSAWQCLPARCDPCAQLFGYMALYSLDLASADFLFPHLKRILKGTHFADILDIQRRVNSCYNWFQKIRYLRCQFPAAVYTLPKAYCCLCVMIQFTELFRHTLYPPTLTINQRKMKIYLFEK